MNSTTDAVPNVVAGVVGSHMSTATKVVQGRSRSASKGRTPTKKGTSTSFHLGANLVSLPTVPTVPTVLTETIVHVATKLPKTPKVVALVTPGPEGPSEVEAQTLPKSAGRVKTPRAPRVPKPEPLLTPNPHRHVLFPIKHPDVFEMYKRHQAAIWTAEEVDMSKDLKDWEKLSAGERHFITHVLAFFAASDGIVMENLSQRFSNEVQWPEARNFYAVQNYMEGVHSETYSLLIEEYIRDAVERDKVLHAVDTMPCIKKKADWAMQWISNKDVDFATRLIGFAAVEGIFFSGAFCAIYWLKERGLMPGLYTSNEWIARDEGIHTTFACLLYSHLLKRVPKVTVFKMIREAVKIEKEFIVEALPCSLIGMNSAQMSQYLEFVADRLLLQLGYPKMFETTNPFAFMERIGMQGKDNFFEKRVTSYSKAGINVTAEKREDRKAASALSSTADF